LQNVIIYLFQQKNSPKSLANHLKGYVIISNY